MGVNYIGGAIQAVSPFFEKSCYDVANNLISAQFDGRGAVSKYAVINKFSVFSSYYPLFSVNGAPVDYFTKKRVTMIGKKQVVEFSSSGADFVIKQFLDNNNNAVYSEVAISAAASDIEFKSVVNYGIDFASYAKELFGSRFSLKTLFSIIKRFVFPKKPGIKDCGDCLYIHNDIFGDYYLDFALSSNGEALERIGNFYTQFKFGGNIKKGETKRFRYVLSAGTRGDANSADVVERLKSFDSAEAEADGYIEYLKSAVPMTVSDELTKSYYVSLINCALSNYKELGRFKGFLAGVVYQ
ncbi:MAG: hypothetical protein EOM87_10325, partial [Clostridia bacterium]|nr:hypothetical protein [Clostridia bacterium]